MSDAQDGEWLVVVDMQRVFADPLSDWATPGFEAAADGIERLLPRYRGRTVFTRFVAPDRPSGAWGPYYARWPFALRPPQDRMWDVVQRFDVRDAPVVTAPTFGKWGPALAEAVRHGRRLLLTGVSTDCCVLSTALAAADAGQFVRVAGDACAGLSDEDHERALNAMALYEPLVTVTSVDGVLRGPEPAAVPVA